MKKVVSPSEVAHFFANKTQSEARTPTSHFYFNNETLYSYGSHFVVARHVKNSEGIPAVLFTTRQYSRTTNDQISIARHACKHLNIVYCASPGNDTQTNLDLFLKEAENVMYNVSQAKQNRTKAKAFLEMAYVSDKVQKYCNFYGIEIPINLNAALNVKIEDLEQYKKDAEILEQKQKAAQLKANIAKHKIDLKKWRAGLISSLYLHDGYDYLKVNGTNVKTSQGVEILLKNAKILFNNIIAGTNLVGLKLVDKYEINEVNKDFIKIGCHKITIKEIKKFATSQKW